MAVSGFSLLLAAVAVLVAVAGATMPAFAVGTPELSASLRPAETPPPDFTAPQYIDSAGCVFLRTDAGWQARVTREGAPICGYPPTFSARRTDPDTLATLFPEPEVPRGMRIQRDLALAIIPNLEAGELAKTGEGPFIENDGTQDPSRDPVAIPPLEELGRVAKGAGDLSRQMARSTRIERLCSLIGGTATDGEPGLCGTGPVLTASRSSELVAPPRGKGETTQVTKENQGGATTPKADGAPRSAAKNAKTPPKSTEKAARPRQDEGPGAGLIPPGARYVQVGAFRDAEQARDTAQRLVAMGLPVARSRKQEGGPDLIMVGPLEGREAIVRMIDRLRRAGFANIHARR